VRWRREEAGPEGDPGAGIEFEPGPGRDALAAIVDKVKSRDPNTVSRLFRVLVVEDNKHVAQLITEGLRGSSRRDFGGVSFVFRNAEDGRAAVEILRKETFDALIIDVYLPILDGPRVIMQARTELGLADLPIIAVSAGGDAARRSALEAGANIFLDKPMRLRQVIDTMQRLLAG
jgi:CheY-like chemotaxis protein